MDDVYVVTKESVYRHEIYGIFRKEIDAQKCAEHCISKESDDYHDFSITKIAFDSTIVPEYENQDGYIGRWCRNGIETYYEKLEENDG